MLVHAKKETYESVSENRWTANYTENSEDVPMWNQGSRLKCFQLQQITEAFLCALVAFRSSNKECKQKAKGMSSKQTIKNSKYISHV